MKLLIALALGAVTFLGTAPQLPAEKADRTSIRIDVESRGTPALRIGSAPASR